MANGVSFLHSRDGKTESREVRSPENKVNRPFYGSSPLERPGEGKTESREDRRPETKVNLPLYVPSPLERPGEVKSGKSEDRSPETKASLQYKPRLQWQTGFLFL